MTLKDHWEKAGVQNQLPDTVIHEMVKQALPDKKLHSYEIISSGSLNINVKINMGDNKASYILRVYLRDKNAAYREQKLSYLLKNNIPMPFTYYVGNYDKYQFAITEFKDGISLRDLLLSQKSLFPQQPILSQKPFDLSAIMHEVGILLSKIAAYQFPISGSFDNNLNVTETFSNKDLLSFTNDCLKHPNILEAFNSSEILKIKYLLDKYSVLLPSESDRNLVHADFKPANILVAQIDHYWKISGVLDWEFSFSGSVMCDVASMLRYTHQMPTEFEKSFLQGLQSGGINLPEDWRFTIHILNIIAMLDFLQRDEPKNHPKQKAGILNLMKFFLEELDKNE